MKKTFALLLAAAMLFCVVFAGCGSNDAQVSSTADSANNNQDVQNDTAQTGDAGEIDEEATLVVPVTSDIATLNMLQNCLVDNGLTLLGGVYDHLLLLNQDGSVEYRLAENVDVSEDGTVYTMKIREGRR